MINNNERVKSDQDSGKRPMRALSNLLKNMREGARGEEFSFVDFDSLAEVGKFLDKYEVENSGGYAFIMRSNNDPDYCIRIPFTNIVGSKWLKQYLQKRRDVSTGNEMQIAFAILNIPKNVPKDEIKAAGVKLLEKARSHNDFYVMDPSSTVPINVVYRFKGEPLGYGMKFLEGEEVEHKRDLSYEETEKLRTYTGHSNPRNILRVSPESSPHSLQIIDINPPGDNSPLG